MLSGCPSIAILLKKKGKLDTLRVYPSVRLALSGAELDGWRESIGYPVVVRVLESKNGQQIWNLCRSAPNSPKLQSCRE
jgi:hypothetical protein